MTFYEDLSGAVETNHSLFLNLVYKKKVLNISGPF